MNEFTKYENKLYKLLDGQTDSKTKELSLRAKKVKAYKTVYQNDPEMIDYLAKVSTSCHLNLIL